MVGAPSVGRRQFGVPPGGAADKESQLLANALLGRSALEPVLEIPLMGGEWAAEEACLVAVVGAECQVSVGGRALPCQSRFRLLTGERLSLGPCTRGARVYVAASVPIDLQTSSEFSLAAVSHGHSSRGLLRLAQVPSSLNPYLHGLRVLRGPQGTDGEFDRLLSADWTVSPVSDRRGVRMMEKLDKAPEELPSEPACVGTVQITADGTPIVFGVDGPTIAGYPKLAVVIEAQHDLVGQLAPGSCVRFEPSSLETAKGFMEIRERRLSDLVRGIGLSLKSVGETSRTLD